MLVRARKEADSLLSGARIGLNKLTIINFEDDFDPHQWCLTARKPISEKHENASVEERWTD